MSDSTTSYNTTARQSVHIDPAEEPISDDQVTTVNSTGVVTVSNTETIVNARPTPDAAVADNTNTLVIKLHDSGLIEFPDVYGNIVHSRQVTLRKLVEKLIDCGIVA
jgi:hypothetical protein